MSGTSRRTLGTMGLALAAAALIVSLRALPGETKTVIPPTPKSPLGPPAAPAKDDGRLIVHEWGTFTNFSGSDGIQLEFRPTIDRELPNFVLDRAQSGLSLFRKPIRVAQLRMETPVTYFYTDRPRDVEVCVRFPQGLLTEFYPPVQSLGPAYVGADRRGMTHSFLDWGRVHLIPAALFPKTRLIGVDGKPLAAALPAVSGDDHYGLARATDSAVVATSAPLGEWHFEKFLFYRGLGNFELPVKLQALSGGRFSVTNFGNEPIRAMFLVHVEQGRLRFLAAGELPANAARYLEEPATDSTSDALGTSVERSLRAAGLYEKEARAMVATWRSSWFGEEGTRLFYLLPQSLTERILPLSVKPAPREMVRVLVGRIEIMTPEREQQIATTIQEMGTCLDPAVEPIHSELQELGRFAEPALGRVLRDATDENLRESVRRLLSSAGMPGNH